MTRQTIKPKYQNPYVAQRGTLPFVNNSQLLGAPLPSRVFLGLGEFFCVENNPLKMYYMYIFCIVLKHGVPRHDTPL